MRSSSYDYFKFNGDGGFCLTVNRDRRMGLRVDIGRGIGPGYSFVRLVGLHPNADNCADDFFIHATNYEIGRSLDLNLSLKTTKIAEIEKELKQYGKLRRIDKVKQAEKLYLFYEFTPHADRIKTHAETTAYVRELQNPAYTLVQIDVEVEEIAKQHGIDLLHGYFDHLLVKVADNGAEYSEIWGIAGIPDLDKQAYRLYVKSPVQEVPAAQ